jgi:cell division protein FtsA
VGASQLAGLVEMAEFIFEIPVRRGMPSNVGGLTDVVKSAEYATSVGLIQYGYNQNKNLYIKLGQEMKSSETGDGLTRKIKDFFGQIF